ncbi:MAG: SIMPL domain-containing protein [Patescibacteria group bacterium]
MENKSLSKNLLSWLLVGLTAVGILFLICLGLAVKNWSSSLLPVRTIIVNGEGEVILKPNISVVSFSVVSEGKDVVALQNENNTKINQAIAFVKNQKVDEKDIKTAGYNLSLRYVYDSKIGRSSIDGYNLTQTVTVKIRDLNNVNKILGGLPGLGINQINGPNFSVDDLESYLSEAREKAFKNAREKAEEQVRFNGVRLGRVISFNEGSRGNYPGPIYLEAMGKGGDMGSVLPTIEPGSEEVKVTVTVTFEIK